MKNHGLIQVDKVLLMQIRMEEARREKEKREKEQEEKLLIATIDFWEQFDKSLEKKKQKKDWNFNAPKIDFTKDSEYKRLFG